MIVANLIAQIAFGLLVMTLCLPSMQEWGAVFGTGQATVQLTFSAYVVSFGALQLAYGPWSDRIGRRRVLLVGLAIAAVGSVIAALATDIATLVAARALQGAGAAAGTVAGRASVQDFFSGPQRTRVMAYVGMVMGLCPPLATIVGGQLHVRFGWQANFWLMTALAVVLIAAAWFGLPPKATDAGAKPEPWLRETLAAYARLLHEREFVLHVAILAFTVAAFYAFLAGAPLVLRSYGVGPDRVGWFIMAVPLSYILGNFATSRLVQRFGERRLMGAGLVLSLAGPMLMMGLAAAGLHVPLAFSIPLMLVGLGHGLLTPTALTRSVGLLPALAGSAAAIAGLMQQSTGAVGGWVVGWFTHDGPMHLGAVMVSFTLGAVAMFGLLHRRPATT